MVDHTLLRCTRDAALGGPREKVRLLGARLRAGQVSWLQLEVRALVGDRTAGALTGVERARTPRHLAEELAVRGPLLPVQAAAQAAWLVLQLLEQAEWLLPLAPYCYCDLCYPDEPTWPQLDDRPRQALEAAQDWLDRPTAERAAVAAERARVLDRVVGTYESHGQTWAWTRASAACRSAAAAVATTRGERVRHAGDALEAATEAASLGGATGPRPPLPWSPRRPSRMSDGTLTPRPRSIGPGALCFTATPRGGSAPTERPLPRQPEGLTRSRARREARMTDRTLQKFVRAAAQGGPREQVRLLGAQLRAGQVSWLQLEARALVGDRTAGAVTGVAPARTPRHLAEELAKRGPLLPLRAAAQAAWLVLPLVEVPEHGAPRPWCRCGLCSREDCRVCHPDHGYWGYPRLPCGECHQDDLTWPGEDPRPRLALEAAQRWLDGPSAERAGVAAERAQSLQRAAPACEEEPTAWTLAVAACRSTASGVAAAPSERVEHAGHALAAAADAASCWGYTPEEAFALVAQTAVAQI
jgi:hypothetical protein